MPGPSRSYDINTRPAGSGIMLRYADRGVTLHHDCIAWSEGGVAHEASLGDIVALRLQVGTIDAQRIGTASIGFADGRGLNVNGSSDYGFFDAERGAAYRAFVQDLCRRLGAREGQVAFLGGAPEGRRPMLIGLMVIVGLFFVALPIVLVIAVRSLDAVLAAVGAIAASATLYAKLTPSLPRTFDPPRIPPELLP